MARTVSELADALTQLGYPTTKRRLIDWMQKGLLPHPVQRGRGRGSGALYSWPQPDIVRRAVDVAELLTWYGRVRGLYLPLWLLGHDVPLDLVRTKLLARLDAALAGRERAVPKGGDLRDLVSDLAWDAVENWRGPSVPFPTAAVEALLAPILDPGHPPDNLGLEALMAALAALGPAGAPAPGAIQQGLDFVRGHLSLPEVRDLVATASADELARAHTDLRLASAALRSLLPLLPEVPEWVAIRFLVHLGYWGVLLDLALRRAGQGERVDAVLASITDFCCRALTNPQLRAAARERLSASSCQVSPEEGEQSRREME